MTQPSREQAQQRTEVTPRTLRSLGREALNATGLPLLAQKAKETMEMWPEMNRTAKNGAIAANALSTARFADSVIHAAKPDTARGWGDTAREVANALTDTLDGNIARRTGGKTPFGAAYDPMTDKWTSWIKATSLAARGRISWIHPVARISRDVIVSWYRDKATRDSGGTVDISATPTSDPLSGKYSTVNFFITNTLLDSPLGRELPSGQREVIAWLSTTHLALTGIANIVRLHAAKTKKAAQS